MTIILSYNLLSHFSHLHSLFTFKVFIHKHTFKKIYICRNMTKHLKTKLCIKY